MPRKYRKSSRRYRGSKRQNQSGGNNDQTTAGAAAPQISQETLQQAGKIAQQFLNNAMGQNTGQKGGSAGVAETTQASEVQNAIVGGAVAGANAGAIAAAEGYSSLKGSPLVGGRRSKRGRGRGRGRQNQNQNQHQNQQSGGMVPGLMTAVETALVPLGLYLCQKTLQSRKSGSRSLGKSFNFRRSSRRSRRRWIFMT